MIQNFPVHFELASGSPLAGGKVTFRLSTDAMTGDDSLVTAGRVVSVTLDANGDGQISLWPTDQLTPDTVYIVNAYSSRGQLIWSGELDIGTVISANYLVQEDGISVFELEDDALSALILET